MSQSPFFITGANAKIRLNGKTLAFCTDVQYSVQVLTQTPKILGMYEGSSVEPLGYSVSGSFTIIRYTKDATAAIGNNPHGIAKNDAGNGVGNWGAAWDKGFGNFLSANGIGNDGRANEALNPGKFASGTTFDIEIYQKFNKGTNNANSLLGFSKKFLQQVANEVANAATGTIGNNDQDVIGVARIKNARITQSDFRLTKKGVAVQSFNFVALYADEDAFATEYSGKGQHF